MDASELTHMVLMESLKKVNAMSYAPEMNKWTVVDYTLIVFMMYQVINIQSAVKELYQLTVKKKEDGTLETSVNKHVWMILIRNNV